MAISANTLFHFTEKEKLKLILQNNFSPNYRLEDLSNATPPKSRYKQAYIPMVCFCDLVFSQIKKHIDFYGDYGIGLRKKEWGIERGISPIYYIPKNSISAHHIQAIAIEINKKLTKKAEQAVISEQLQNFYKYVKPYNGKKDDEIFYNEREWRYVPPDFPVLSKRLNKRREIDEANANLKKSHKLEFSAKDIKYIVVKDENEIPEFVDFIYKKLKNRFFNINDRKILISKLISVNQIEDDM
jgi:hypothetical protein